MIVATPRPSSPTRRAHAPSSRISADAFERLPSLSLSRSMWNALRLAVRKDARQQVTRQPAGRLREHEERVAHRRGAEPLVTVQRRLAVSHRPRDRLVRAHVRAALPLGHRHAAERTRLVRRRPEPGVVHGRREQRRPLLEERRLRAQRRHRRERHRERTADAGLDLRERDERGRSRDVRARPRLTPRRRMQTALTASPSSSCHAGWNSTSSIRVAEAIVRPEPRRVLVREPSELERLAAEQPAERRAAPRLPSPRPRARPPRRAAGSRRRGRIPRAAAAGCERAARSSSRCDSPRL